MSVQKRERISASFWWGTVVGQFKTLAEFIAKAQKAELKENGHECGHRFEITVRSATHMSGTGEHTDVDWWGDQKPVIVRAHNLRDALLVAATLPLNDWFQEEER
jgi:hypothetical protein